MKTLNWYGSFSQGQGYSGTSEKMAIALDKLFDVRVMGFANDNPKNITMKGKKLKKKPFKLGDVGICYGFPNAFTSLFNHKVKIGFSMFETNKLPSGKNEWAGKSGKCSDIINKLDCLLVPSEHNKKLFKNSGVTIPIRVVHLGVDIQSYVKMDRPERDIFTFYMAGVLTIRKNPGALISAFLDLFKDNLKVRIVFKTNSGTLGHMTFPYSNIQIIDEFSSPEKMFTLMRDADAFVFPSRGEGFGLPPLEAMATGLPTIFANNTGMSEYANELFNYPVPAERMSKAVHFPKRWGDMGEWHEIDYNKLKETMQFVYDNQKLSKEKGLKSADWVRENWTFEKTAKEIEKIVKEFSK